MDDGKEQNLMMSAIDELLSADRLHPAVDPTPSIAFTPVVGAHGIPLQPRAIIVDPADEGEKDLDPNKQTSQSTPLEAWLQEEERHVQAEKKKGANRTKFQQKQAYIVQAQLDNQREKEQLRQERFQLEKEKEALRAKMQNKGSTNPQEKGESKEAPKGKPSGAAAAKEMEEWEKIFVLNPEPIPRERAGSTTSKRSSRASSRDARMDALKGQVAGLEGKMDSATQKICRFRTLHPCSLRRHLHR